MKRPWNARLEHLEHRGSVRPRSALKVVGAWSLRSVSAKTV